MGTDKASAKLCTPLVNGYVYLPPVVDGVNGLGRLRDPNVTNANDVKPSARFEVGEA